jgi:NADH-quinone oxidoreductase subunit C
MTREELKQHITPYHAATVFDETGEWLIATVDAPTFKPFAQWLRNGGLQMDYLFCLTAIDWSATATGKNLLTVVYHFTSTTYRHTLVVKVNLDRTNPEIETVSDIWRTADFHEREASELFGVQFLHHPDLRKLILTDDFEGYPLRKDFEDPVNMIKL